MNRRHLAGLARAVRVATDLARVLPASVAYALTEHTTPPTLPTLEQMTNERDAAESHIRRPRWL